jgi:3-methyladenine DNA glycosylase AlkC
VEKLGAAIPCSVSEQSLVFECGMVRDLLRASSSSKTRVETRRGAIRPSSVPQEVRQMLESGIGETVNLMEQIAIDQSVLMASVIPSATARYSALKSARITDRMWCGGRAVLDAFGTDGITVAQGWASDTARGWGAMAVGLLDRIPLEQRIKLAIPFALDDNFTVREWAWIGIRNHVIGEIETAVPLFADLALHPEDRMRRFASEATRPRGVWCKHITILKSEPERAETILSPLQADPSRYVQLSVGNWLNDASKSRPDWTFDICSLWSANPSVATQFITSRGLRTLKSNGTQFSPDRY